MRTARDVDETTDLTKTLKEAAYVAIGFGVLGFQRAQVRRRQVTEVAQDLERRLQPALMDASERVEPLLDQIRRAAIEARDQLRG